MTLILLYRAWGEVGEEQEASRVHPLVGLAMWQCNISHLLATVQCSVAIVTSTSLAAAGIFDAAGSYRTPSHFPMKLTRLRKLLKHTRYRRSLPQDYKSSNNR